MKKHSTFRWLPSIIGMCAGGSLGACNMSSGQAGHAYTYRQSQSAPQYNVQEHQQSSYSRNSSLRFSHNLDSAPQYKRPNNGFYAQPVRPLMTPNHWSRTIIPNANYMETDYNTVPAELYTHPINHRNKAKIYSVQDSQDSISSSIGLDDYTSNMGANPLSGRPATTLRHSMGNAFEVSPRIAAERLKIEEAHEGYIQAKSGSLLKSELKGSLGGRQSDTVYNIIDRRDSSFRFGQSIELDLSLPIFQGGRVKAQKQSAKVRIKAAKANLEAVQGQVLQSTAIVYLEVFRDRKLVNIYRQNLKMLREQQRIAQILLSQNESTLTDRALIDTRLSTISINLEMAIADLKSSESRYQTLVGMPAPVLQPIPALPLPESLYEIKTIARKNNPEIRSIQTQVEAAIYDVDFAKSSSKPTLALQGILRGSRGQTEPIDRNTAAELLLNLRVPLLSGGENRSKVRQAELAKSRMALEVYASNQRLNERAETLWAELQAAQRKKALNRDQIGAAELAYQSIFRQREAGLATTLDMFSIEQTLLDARLSGIRIEYSEALSRIQLLNLMGAAP